MERVQRIGGVFIFSGDVHGLAQWYMDMLGMKGAYDSADEAYYLEYDYKSLGEKTKLLKTVWVILPSEVNPNKNSSRFMMNFLVNNLDDMIGRLKNKDIVIEKTGEHDCGRFAWIKDKEGNPIELFEVIK
ncbi:MAG: VOC family protein [Methanococcaceae archaeon]